MDGKKIKKKKFVKYKVVWIVNYEIYIFFNQFQREAYRHKKNQTYGRWE